MNELVLHSKKIKKLINKVDPKIIGKWLMENGYYPEPSILPPSFRVKDFILEQHPKNIVKSGEFKPKLSKENLVTISYPKSELTNRIFGIYHPEYYHDMVWYMVKHWKTIKNHLFKDCNKIHSYSFPIPLSISSNNEKANLRAGRMIYQYLELAEKDLFIESYKYNYLVKADVKNFYASIYTHSISWALHTKAFIRSNGNFNNLKYIGNILDKLVQYSNDGKTNGLVVGPAISDLLAEIILTAVDTAFSKAISTENFIAARYKDDYYFLVSEKNTGIEILKNLQNSLGEYNLFLNEEKTQIRELPNGLIRPWIQGYDKFYNSLLPKKTSQLTFNNFTILSKEVIHLNTEYPETGLIPKFFADLTMNDSNYSLNIDFSKLKNKRGAVLKAYSTLIHLSNQCRKSFPGALGVIEAMLRSSDDQIPSRIKNDLIQELEKFGETLIKLKDEHKSLWWNYFVLTNNIMKTRKITSKLNHYDSVLLKSIKTGKKQFFKDCKCTLFNKPHEDLENPIAKYLDLFPKLMED